MQEIDAVIDQYSGKSRIALDYSQIIKSLVDGAHAGTDFSSYWEPLAALVAPEEFVRVGNFKEVMNLQEYTSFLSNWAPAAEWECSFKRISEIGNIVFLELEERTRAGGIGSTVNSLSVYEFSDENKIHHVDIYLQMPMPDLALLKGYEGVNISA